MARADRRSGAGQVDAVRSGPGRSRRFSISVRGRAATSRRKQDANANAFEALELHIYARRPSTRLLRRGRTGSRETHGARACRAQTQCHEHLVVADAAGDPAQPGDAGDSRASSRGSRPTPSRCTEQDILGDRLVRPRRSTRKLENFISEVTSFPLVHLVVHVEHAIGRFAGLQTLDVGGAPHDCLELHDGWRGTNRSRRSRCCRASARSNPNSTGSTAGRCARRG